MPRIEVEGKLIGINCDSTNMKLYDPKNEKYSWLQLSLVIGQNPDGSAIYRNVTAYKIDFKEMPELKKADELLKQKKKPLVKLQCYATTKDAVDKETKQPIMEETKEIRDGKEVIIQKQKKWTNYRMAADDVKNTFKILEEDVSKDNEPKEDIQEIEM